MPKSRFNAVREKARASRHNPIHSRAGKASLGQDETREFALRPKASASANDGNDVLPVLKSLPLDRAELDAAAHNEVLWALTSLAGFLSVKAQRAELLLPKHQLVRRILVHLHGDGPIEVRDAASGCLRNLCIEAGSKARRMLEERECIPACIAEVRTTAQDLDLLEGTRSMKGASDPARSTVKPDTSFLSKPKSEMNRKERRHAAKAEALAAKKSARQPAEENVNGPQDAAMSIEPERETERAELTDEQLLLCYSHVNNLIATLWCIAEMSSAALDVCEQHAELLCAVFAKATERALIALSQDKIQERAAAEPRARIVDVGKQDKAQLDKASIELALTSLNALVTMSESNARFCAAMAGVSRQELTAATKGKKKSVVFDATDDSGVASKSIVVALQSAVCASLQRRAEDRQRTISVLALASLHNALAALPSNITNSLRVGQDPESPNIGDFELETGISLLQKVVSEASASNLNRSLSTAEDRIGTLSLALEVLAEIAGDRQGWNVEEKRNRAQDNDIEVDEVVDEEMDEGQSEDESDSQSISSEDLMDKAGHGAHQNGSALDFAATRIAPFFHSELLDPLSQLSFRWAEKALSLPQSDATENAATSRALRGIAIRSLSVLSNLTLALASFAQPPPSQPVDGSAQEERIAAFHKWLQGSEVSKQMGQLWRWSFELASRIAILPQIHEAAPAAQQDVSVGVELHRIMESCLGIMWSLSRVYESVTDAREILPVEPSAFAADSFCVSASQGSGVIESLIAAYRSSKQSHGAASQTSAEDAEGSAASISSSDPTTWASADGIRVHCLGVLSTMIRQPHVWPSKAAPIATLLCAAVEAVPVTAQKEQNGAAASFSQTKLAQLELSDATSPDGVVVAVNGLIDTFADETQPWDSVYTQLKLQARLKRASQDVRQAARTIDKRKQVTLRAAADDAWSNIVGFLQYRDTLR